jgi:hypothetical protein
MSAILKGLLQPQILTVLQSYGTAQYIGPPDPIAAQVVFADKLSTAIAVAVQQYILTSVVTDLAPGPVTHIHKLQELAP